MSAALATHDVGPMARFEERTADPSVPSVVFQRLCDGETLKDIAKAWEVPVGRFTQWYTETHGPLFDAALKVRADQLANEALEIADEQKEAVGANGQRFDPEVPRDKLRVDTRMRLLEKWDRARYGSKDGGSAANITVIVDRSCGGAVEVEAGGAKARIPLASTEASR